MESAEVEININLCLISVIAVYESIGSWKMMNN